jgi:hypothetical protein
MFNFDEFSRWIIVVGIAYFFLHLFVISTLQLKFHQKKQAENRKKATVFIQNKDNLDFRQAKELFKIIKKVNFEDPIPGGPPVKYIFGPKAWVNRERQWCELKINLERYVIKEYKSNFDLIAYKSRADI